MLYAARTEGGGKATHELLKATHERPSATHHKQIRPAAPRPPPNAHRTDGLNCLRFNINFLLEVGG